MKLKPQNNLFSDSELNQLTEDSNHEQIEEMKITPDDLTGIFNMSVNWTFEGICNLVENGSIGLSPSFQRGNVWEDSRKSKLIESIYLGLPIPPIILAEVEREDNSEEDNSKRYVVVDGKQRLQAMIGFFNPKDFPYWEKPKLSDKLEIAAKLKGLSYNDFGMRDKRVLNNMVVPTWTMYNIKQSSVKVLNHIFYRMNAGAVPLNFQELRQAKYYGGFSNFLAEISHTLQPFQEVMGYNQPDERMNDVEYLVRIFGNKFFQNKYKNSLSDFLDMTMKELNKNWKKIEQEVRNYYDNLNIGIQFLEKIWGEKKKIGKMIGESSPFNKAYCEVQLYYFSELNELLVNEKNIILYHKNLNIAFENRNFSDLFTRGTNGNYRKRFEEFKRIIDNSFKINQLA